MSEQIIQGIVMFLVGSVCTFVMGKAIGIFTTQADVAFGLQSVLRDRMTQMHRFYTDKKKPIPQQEVDSFLQMYDAYKRLGGNGYIDNIRHAIVEVMPHENH